MAVSQRLAVRDNPSLRRAGLIGGGAMELLHRAADATIESTRAHPLSPAAVRIERSRVRQEGARADQTALTIWFGSGPNLPGPGLPSGAARFAARAAFATVGAAALGALAVIASHREAQRSAVPRLH